MFRPAAVCLPAAIADQVSRADGAGANSLGNLHRVTDDAAPHDSKSCESCGSVATDIVEVRRVYVTPASWESEESVELGDIELWCFVCRTHYPHQVPG